MTHEREPRQVPIWVFAVLVLIGGCIAALAVVAIAILRSP